MKRLICIASICVMALCVVGCGGGAEGGSVDLEQLKADILAVDDELPDLTIISAIGADSSEDAGTTFSILADFDYSKVAQFFYASSSTGSPEEIAVVELKDKSDAADLMRALRAHLDNRKTTFQQYSPEEVSMLDNAILTYEGNYVLYAVANKNGLIQDVFKKAVG